LTCHNRREKTIACLHALFVQQLPQSMSLAVFLVDDGSSDGTGEAVRREFPSVHVLDGTGSLYWNRGMRLAFGEAMNVGFEYYLWLNDDTLLFPNAIAKLLATHEALGAGKTGRGIVVGSTCDPDSGEVTFGGCNKSSFWHPLALRVDPPGNQPKLCDTFQGNCVLVSTAVANLVGNLSQEFVHGLGDNDYGLRAAKLGIESWIAPGFVGSCRFDHPPLSHYRTKSLRERWQRLVGPMIHPPRAWATYCKRHGGPLWPLFWLRPYLRDSIVLFGPGGARIEGNIHSSPKVTSLKN